MGFDDILTFQYQRLKRDAYRLESFRYLVPVTNNTQVGFYSTRNQIQLQEQFKDTMARGKSDIYGGFVNQTLDNDPDLKIVADLGFDYKDVYNFLLGVMKAAVILNVWPKPVLTWIIRIAFMAVISLMMRLILVFLIFLAAQGPWIRIPAYLVPVAGLLKMCLIIYASNLAF